MSLERKKSLAQRTLHVGKNKIFFVPEHIDEIQKAITKQDIRELLHEGAIIVKERNGRRTIMRKKRKRGQGKIKKTIINRKRNYIIITRKCRAYLKTLKINKKISLENYSYMRKKIRTKSFSSLAQCKEHIRSLME